MITLKAYQVIYMTYIIIYHKDIVVILCKVKIKYTLHLSQLNVMCLIFNCEFIIKLSKLENFNVKLLDSK